MTEQRHNEIAVLYAGSSSMARDNAQFLLNRGYQTLFTPNLELSMNALGGVHAGRIALNVAVIEEQLEPGDGFIVAEAIAHNRMRVPTVQVVRDIKGLSKLYPRDSGSLAWGLDQPRLLLIEAIDKLKELEDARRAREIDRFVPTVGMTDACI